MRRLLGKFPNTYTYTKQIGEDIVRSEGKGLPIGIHRPSIVTPTYKEPLKGWTNSIIGAAGLGLGVGLGLIRVLQFGCDVTVNHVPADMVVNSIIASAWDVTNKLIDINSRKGVSVYNYEGSRGPGLNYTTYWKKCNLLIHKYFSVKAIWHVYHIICETRSSYVVIAFFLHTLPAFLVDAVLFCLGKRPMMIKIYRKIHMMVGLLAYFTTRDWNFESSNTRLLIENMSHRDRVIFFSDMKNINWDEYLLRSALGVRTYLAKDPLDTVPQGQRKFRR
ncbi:hypothetical protein NQ315_008321 [Exocentrus adspersus]|uniref:Fatty acyl-CoA reductase n=1 Tax=Exocentrus adspersus TaxID=1586481 RepID=A0AAV8V5J3_9CUCU|nr:hypothetical protein NQ315_008321 [Exocentrus adspersus]